MPQMFRAPCPRRDCGYAIVAQEDDELFSTAACPHHEDSDLLSTKPCTPSDLACLEDSLLVPSRARVLLSNLPVALTVLALLVFAGIGVGSHQARMRPSRAIAKDAHFLDLSAVGPESYGPPPTLPPLAGITFPTTTPSYGACKAIALPYLLLRLQVGGLSYAGLSAKSKRLYEIESTVQQAVIAASGKRLSSDQVCVGIGAGLVEAKILPRGKRVMLPDIAQSIAKSQVCKSVLSALNALPDLFTVVTSVEFDCNVLKLKIFERKMTTTLAKSAKVGSKAVVLANAAGLAPGQSVVVAASTRLKETNTIMSSDSLTVQLQDPLKFAHDHGTIFEVQAAVAPVMTTTTRTTTPATTARKTTSPIQKMTTSSGISPAAKYVLSMARYLTRGKGK